MKSVRVTPDEIALVAGGGAWMGTFGVLVRTLFADLLSDGAPVTARIEWDDGGDQFLITALSGETHLVTNTGLEIRIEDITAVKV